MNKLLKLSLIPFSLIFLFFISTNFISAINAQIFEFDEEDYFSLEEKEKDSTTTNSQDTSSTTNSDDTDKETCINNQIESVLSTNNDMNSDSYF